MVLLTAIWGFQQVSIKVAIVEGLSPSLQAALRSVGAGLCLTGWIAWREGRAGLGGLLARATRARGVALGVVFALEFVALYAGLQRTTASRGVLFIYGAPFFVALGTHLLVPGERLRARQAVGLLLAFGGMAAAFAEGLMAGGGSIEGDALCLLGGMLWAATTLMVRTSPAMMAAPPARVLWLQLVISAPLLVLAAVVQGEVPPFPRVGGLGWLALAFQTVVVAFASYLAWFRLIQVYPAARVAGFTFLAPLFGIIAGWALMGDALSWGLLAGVVAIGLGIRMVNARD